MFSFQFHPLYFVAFVLILGGVVVYCSKETPQHTRDQQETRASAEQIEHIHVVEEPPTCHSVVSEDDEIHLTVHAEDAPANVSTDTSPDEKTPLNTNGQ
jgi:hypothetical protein